MKISFIVGNGFNYLIEFIIRKMDDHLLPDNLSGSRHEIANRINEISSLWKKFDVLFKELKQSIPKVNDEELIRMIYAVLDFFSNIEAFQKVLSKEDLEKIKKTFDFLLIDKVKEIAEEFRVHQHSEGYKDLKRLFPDFGENFKSILDKYKVQNCDFFTTNYDGILDTLLTKKERGFLSVDGFGNMYGNSRHLKLYEYNLKGHQIRSLHIHGSYRYEKRFSNTFKTKLGVENADPVIVFNNPNQKEEIINRDSVLREYYSHLELSLETHNKLIIFGNSMVNEPHLKKKIKEHFNKDDQYIYACSRNPVEIAKQLDGFHKNAITQKSTKNITSINDLLTLFDGIISHVP